MATPLTQAPQLVILNRTTSLMDIMVGVSVSSGAADAFMPVVLNAQGLLDPNLTGTGVLATAAGALSAGNLVNLYSSLGVVYARQASAAASPNNFPAVGFVTAAYNNSDTATVQVTGRFIYYDNNAEFAATDIGATVYLSATQPGNITKTPPGGVGQSVQDVGYVIGFSAGTPAIVTVAFGATARNFSQITGTCAINQGGTGATTAATALTNLLAGSYAINQVLASPSSGGAGNIAPRALVEADLPATVALTDKANTFGAFLQKFQAGANFDLVDPTDATKVLQFSVSSIATGTTRTLAIPNANCNPVQPLGSATAHNWIQFIDANGVQNLSQPAAADLSNGVTGTGAVVLAASPTLTGTVGLPIITLTGKVTNYNGIATVANGVAAEYATQDLTGQTAAIVATPLYAVPVSGAGMYRVCVSLILTTAGTAGTISVTIGWNNGVLGNSQTTATLSTTAALGTEVDATFEMYSAASQNITYSTTFSGVTGTPAYTLHLRCEAL